MDQDAIQASFNRDALAGLVVSLAYHLTDGHSDPDVNEEVVSDVRALANMLGEVPSLDAATGIQAALMQLYSEWVLGGTG